MVHVTVSLHNELCETNLSIYYTPFVTFYAYACTSKPVTLPRPEGFLENHQVLSGYKARFYSNCFCLFVRFICQMHKANYTAKRAQSLTFDLTQALYLH